MRKFFYFLFACFCLAAVSSVGLAIYAWDYNEGPGPLTIQKTVIFKKGEGFQGIVTDLTEQGIIDNPILFQAIAVALGEARKFKAGEYNFTAGMTPHRIITMIADGKVVVHKITIPEGLTVREIMQLVKAEPILEGDVPDNIKEGSLMPETYHFIYGDKRQDIVAHMQSAMSSMLATLWPNRKKDLPFDTQEQALTLASIVEKETGLVQERPHVASVFINRLRLGMKLQSDPTVAYGVEQVLGGPLGRSLTTADLRSETPYNTYVIVGLPPAPIANPGRAAIEAVLNPLDSKDLYFVATGTGGHHFAATLAEHNSNVKMYREKIAKQ